MNLQNMELQALQDIIDRKKADNVQDRKAARDSAKTLSDASGTVLVLAVLLVVICLPAILSGSLLPLGIGAGVVGLAGALRGAASLIVSGTEHKVARRENEILDAVTRAQGLIVTQPQPTAAPAIAGQSLPFDAAASNAGATAPVAKACASSTPAP